MTPIRTRIIEALEEATEPLPISALMTALYGRAERFGSSPRKDARMMEELDALTVEGRVRTEIEIRAGRGPQRVVVYTLCGVRP